MNTFKPAKLLVALLLGLGLATAHADNNGNGYGNGNGDNKSSSDNSGDNKSSDNKSSGDKTGTTATTTPNCTSSIVSACGTNIIRTVCTTASNVATDTDKDEENEHHDSGRGQDKDSNHKDKNGNSDTYSDDDRISPRHYAGQENESDFDFDYKDSQGNDHHVDHSERVGTSPDGKITICHRMGGARVTLDVPDDQVNGVKAHGHGNHDMDSIGKCEDEDDSNPDNDAVPRESLKARAQGQTITTAATSLSACLAAPAGSTVTVYGGGSGGSGGSTGTGGGNNGGGSGGGNGGSGGGSGSGSGGSGGSGGTQYQGAGCNAPGVSCTIPVAIPNSGGIRTLR